MFKIYIYSEVYQDLSGGLHLEKKRSVEGKPSDYDLPEREGIYFSNLFHIKGEVFQHAYEVCWEE